MVTVKVIRKNGGEEQRLYQGKIADIQPVLHTLVQEHVLRDPECNVVALDDQDPSGEVVVLHEGLPAEKKEAATEPEPKKEPEPVEEPKPAPKAAPKLEPKKHSRR